MAINLPTIDESKVRVVGALGDHPNVDNNMTAQDLRDAFDQDSVNIREFLNPTVVGSFGNVLKTKIDSMETAIATAQSTATSAAAGSVAGSRITDGSITYAKLKRTSGSEAVTTETIRNGAVTTDKIGSGAVTTEKIAADAVSTIYTGVILTSDWSGSTAPYTAEITVSGILAADKPVIDLNFNTSVASSTHMSQDEAWSQVYRATTAANKITFYAKSKPTVGLPFKALCVRK